VNYLAFFIACQCLSAAAQTIGSALKQMITKHTIWCTLGLLAQAC